MPVLGRGCGVKRRDDNTGVRAVLLSLTVSSEFYEGEVYIPYPDSPSGIGLLHGCDENVSAQTGKGADRTSGDVAEKGAQ
jgi:hypothetical protein